MQKRARNTCLGRAWLAVVALLSLTASVGRAQQGDPAAPQAEVSIGRAIAVAIENHGRVEAAASAIDAARQRIRQVRTGTIPRVDGEVSYRGRGTSNLGGIFGGEPSQVVGTRRVSVDTDSTTFDRGLQPRISLNYNVYDGGETRTAVRQAQAGLDNTAGGLSTVKNNLAFDVTARYLGQLRAVRLLELRETQERLAEAQLRRVEANIEVGRSPRSDLALALSDLRNRQVDRIQAQNDLEVSANALRNAMGLEAGPPLRLVELRQSEAALGKLTELQAAAEAQRPEVGQAEARVRSAEASISLARIQRRPRLDATFAFNVNSSNAFQRGDFAVGAALSMPLWDAGRSHSVEQQARADAAAAGADLRQLRKDIQAEVVEGYLNLVSSRQRLDASKLAVEAARVNLENSMARYEAGAQGASVIEVITAQTQYATAHTNAIQALYDVYLAEAQLARAIGREIPQ